MTESAAFKKFRWSFFEDEQSYRNGLELDALRALQGEERSRAEEMLLRYLPDARRVIGLGELRSLWQIRPDVEWRGARRGTAR